MCYDVNGNGSIENGERGAFKIANSYGTRKSASGYEWVLYDALNYTTSISGTWESQYSGTRICAFSMTTTEKYNKFHYIDVANYDVNFVAEINFDEVTAGDIGISLQKVKNGTLTSSAYSSLPNDFIKQAFTLVMDYESLEEELSTDINSTWGFLLTGTQRTVASANLRDGRGNQIAAMTHLYNTDRYIAMPLLEIGDINYDGLINNSDVTLLQQYCSGYDNLSDLQIFLADFNEDGDVNSKDTSALIVYISNNS